MHRKRAYNGQHSFCAATVSYAHKIFRKLTPSYQIEEHIPKSSPQLVALSVLVLRGGGGKQVDRNPLVDVVVLVEVWRPVFLVQL